MSDSELTYVRDLLFYDIFEIPRRFTFSEVAYARHNSSKLDSALTYSQHYLCRDDK